MALTATRIVFTVPSISTLTRWRLGLNLRLVTPVTLRPTPPRYLALPRRRILLPPTGFFPVIAHCIPIARHLRGQLFSDLFTIARGYASTRIALSAGIVRRYHRNRYTMLRTGFISYLALAIGIGPGLCCCILRAVPDPGPTLRPPAISG